MIKSERLRRGLVVAGTVAVAFGGGIGGVQAAELPELGTPVAASGVMPSMDGITPEIPVLMEFPFGLTGDEPFLKTTQVAGGIGEMDNEVDNRGH
ncbi:hypothetical protein [Streptomyces sp. NPDC058412]|uniref:hypothetical protein n=1 Tax=Streptomyces sp. NPDC058412 TaxID=3346486 RepID=UPI0036489731